MAGNFIQIMMAIDSREMADMVARALLEERLAGCVQIAGPMASRYWWQGKIRNGEEWLIVAKSHMSKYSTVERFVRRRHPYDEHEIVAVPICAASKSYLDWLGKEIGIAR